MKTNTFYNPKNQYNELLASVPYVNAEDAVLRAHSDEQDAQIDAKFTAEVERLDAEDKALHHKIETFNTIGIILIEETSIDNHFSKKLDEMGEEALKIELSRNIYIIKNDELPNTYEEYVYKYASDPNGEVITKENLPTMVRLGAVDSIMAYDDRLGSVQLVHNIYETFEKLANGDTEAHEELKDNFYEVNLDGEFLYHRPKKGKAVAPCALRSFYDADQEITDSLNLEVNARREAIEAEAAERKASDVEIHEELDAHNTRLSHLEAEVEGKVSEVETEMGFSGSRLDRIEAAIGINHHHCENCGCEHHQCSCEDNKCSCSDADNKCTIYCRLNDAEKDREELNEAIFRLDERVTDEVNRLDEADNNLRDSIEKETVARETADNNLQGEIDELSNELTAEIERATEKETKLDNSITAETAARENADDAIWTEIGDKTLAAEGTIWHEIKDIQDKIGTQDAPHEDTIWERINKNKTELSKEIADEVSRASEKERILEKSIEDESKRAAEAEKSLQSDIEDIFTEIGAKSSTDVNIWKSIHDEISARIAYVDEVAEITLEAAKADSTSKFNDAKEYTEEKAVETKDAAVKSSADYTDKEVSDKIAKAKLDLSDQINTKVSSSEYNAKISEIESAIDVKASSSKVEEIENNLNAVSNELQLLTSQTQFAVHTVLPGNASKTISLPTLIGPTSNVWDLVQISSVVANNETIYPEIIYSGQIEDGKNDNRKVTITFEYGNDDLMEVVLIVSAFKASHYRIIEIA